MSAEGIHLGLDLRYVRRLCELSAETVFSTEIPDSTLDRLIRAQRVLDRLIEEAEKGTNDANT